VGIYFRVLVLQNREYIPHYVLVNEMLFSWLRTIKEYLQGIFLYNLISGVYCEKRHLDELVMVLLFGRMIGIPYLFNYYHLRLIPYYAARLGPWKKRVLKERDFFDYVND
jgi:hypothetical protein